MTRVRDVALIRKLCGLGLAPETLAQSLLPALRNLIDSHSGGVFWVDVNGEITNLFAERLLPPDAMARYYERHHKRANEGFAIAFKRRAASADPISIRSFSRTEQGSDYFNEVMRPLDAYHVLYAVLHDHMHPYGQLSLYRGRQDPPFDKRNAETLRSVLRYVSAGLAGTRPSERRDAGSTTVDDQHLGVASLDGTLLSAPQKWLRMLRLVAVDELSPRSASHEPGEIDRFLKDIAATLDRGGAESVRLHRVNARGQFSIRAFRLADVRGRRNDQMAILIQQDEPETLSLLRGLARSDLSPQQREVALLLAQGNSNREIADALRLSLNTASYHVKQVFLRLGVSDRGSITGELLALSRSQS